MPSSSRDEHGVGLAQQPEMTDTFHTAAAKPKSTTLAATAWKKYGCFSRAFSPGKGVAKP